MHSKVSAILISRHYYSGRSWDHREVRAQAGKSLREPEIDIWLDQGKNYSAVASGGAIEGLLLVLGHSEVVENEKANKLPYSRTKGIRATLFSVSLPMSCLEKLLSEWIEKMTLRKTVEGASIRQAKLLISN